MESDGLGLRKMGWRWWEVGKRYGSVAGAEGTAGEVAERERMNKRETKEVAMMR